ncbi:MAG TPA: TolC family protein [Phycisphaerae bacterium]|nr:TolC family protein [Phycisphaerae bacterium]
MNCWTRCKLAAGSAATLLALSACVVYHPSPLKPAESQTAFLARTLCDPKVIEYAHHQSPATQPAGTQPADAWTLEELSRAAIYFNPDLAVVKAHIGTVRAGEITAGEMPNPSINISPQFSSNPGSANPWIVASMFDVPIETAGKREDRIAQAKALTEAAKFDLADATWKTRSRVRDAVVELLIDEQVVGNYEEEVANRTAYAQMLESRLAMGEAARPDVDIARIDLIIARQAWRAAQGQLADARTKLAAAIGVPTAGIVGITITWPGMDRPIVLDSTCLPTLQQAGLLNRLDIRRSLSEYAAAEASLKLEIAKQYPDVHLGPGYEFDQGQNKWGLGLTVDLPILNQNGGAIAEAYGRRNEAGEKFMALQAQVIGEVESAQARYDSALRELDEANSQVTTLNDQVSAGNEQLKAGETDRLTVTGLEVQKEVADRLRLEAIRKAQFARGALEDALERPLPTEVRPLPTAERPLPDASPTTAPATNPHEDLLK